MNKEEAKQAAEIMLAYANGEKIEYKHRNAKEWQTHHYFTFNWYEFEYRVAPKPFEGWVNVYPMLGHNFLHLSKEDADRSASAGRVRCVHVREVI